MIGCCVLILFSIGFNDARLDGSTVTSVFAGVLIFLHIKLSESSVKLSRLWPSFVSLYTFLGLSLFMFHSLLTKPFFSRVPRRG